MGGKRVSLTLMLKMSRYTTELLHITEADRYLGSQKCSHIQLPHIATARSFHRSITQYHNLPALHKTISLSHAIYSSVRWE